MWHYDVLSVIFWKTGIAFHPFLVGKWIFLLLLSHQHCKNGKKSMICRSQGIINCDIESDSGLQKWHNDRAKKSDTFLL